MSRELVERYRRARRDPALAVLEGFHALKHALRFGGEVLEVVVVEATRARDLAEALSPDVTAGLERVPTETVEEAVFERLSPSPPRERIMALARRPSVTVEGVLGSPGPAPVVLLENPRHLGNVGAVVRVSAAAGAAGVLTTGTHDPWHPHALRGGAGLQFAIPTARLAGAPPATDRPLVALDPEGEPLRPGLIPPRALLAFGTERWGLSTALRHRAALRVGIRMVPGVSSLSLATAVAVVLYSEAQTGG